MMPKKVQGQIAAAAPLAGLIAWGWNLNFPEAQMTVEIAGMLGGIVGPVVAWFVSWVPHPHAEPKVVEPKETPDEN